MRLKFERSEDNRWYVVLPEWTGDKAELEMVCGADTLCDILSKGADFVSFDISLTDDCYYNHHLRIANITEGGGATYKMVGGEYADSLIWLCHVTEFVFGYLPENIYIC